MNRSQRPLLLALLALPAMACATASVDIGYAVPTEPDEGDDKWVVEARAATGGIVKVGLAARSKLGEQHDQIALAPELSIEMAPDPVTVGVRLGVHVAQLDHEAGEWTFGARTPYLHPLLQVRLGDPVYARIRAQQQRRPRPLLRRRAARRRRRPVIAPCGLRGSPSRTARNR